MTSQIGNLDLLFVSLKYIMRSSGMSYHCVGSFPPVTGDSKGAPHVTLDHPGAGTS